MTMTPERLAELDAVMAKATAGEWEWRNDQLLPLSDQWTISPGVLIADSNNGTPGGDEIDRANAAAIVALHNAYPDLRALIEAQAATIARQAEALREAQGWFAEYAVMHLDKNTPEGVAKAASNARKAEYCAAALTGAA